MNDLKVYLQNRGVRIAAAIIAAALLLLVLWLVFRPSQDELDKDAAVKAEQSKASHKAAEDRAASNKKETEGAIGSRDQERSVQDPRVAELERQLAREREDGRREREDARQRDARTIALLAQRTEARQADVARLSTTGTSQLRARAAALVGDLQAPDETYANVIRLAVSRDQLRDELGAAKETISSNSKEIAQNAKEIALLQKLADERQASLESEKRNSDRIATMAQRHEEEHATTLAELRAKSESERAAQEKVISRLKGNRFFNAVKTGAKIGAGVGIGIAIGRAMN